MRIEDKHHDSDNEGMVNVTILEIIPGAQVPFEPYKVFDEQTLRVCWVAVSAPVHTDINQDKVSLWKKTDPDLKQKGKNVQFLYQVLWHADSGAPVSCASWDD
jgi:hypothetical protein